VKREEREVEGESRAKAKHMKWKKQEKKREYIWKARGASGKCNK
jgi:hypothetical protein